MEETRGITVKVALPLHTRAKQEAEANEQTMSQFIEAVLQFYFNREDGKKMSEKKRTLAFQVSEEFFQEVQEYIKARNMRLKDFGITAMRRMLEEEPLTAPEAAPAEPEALPAEPEAEPEAPDNEPEEAPDGEPEATGEPEAEPT